MKVYCKDCKYLEYKLDISAPEYSSEKEEIPCCNYSDNAYILDDDPVSPKRIDKVWVYWVNSDHDCEYYTRL